MFASLGNMLKFILKRMGQRADRPPAGEWSCEGVLGMACIGLAVLAYRPGSVCIWQNMMDWLLIVSKSQNLAQ